MDALKVSGETGERKSPVAVAKALHILAPEFFPLWDNAIAKAYGCHWNSSEESVVRYIDFISKVKQLLVNIDLDTKTWILEGCPDNNNLLKILDEFNYVRYTKRWTA